MKYRLLAVAVCLITSSGCAARPGGSPPERRDSSVWNDGGLSHQSTFGDYGSCSSRNGRWWRGDEKEKRGHCRHR